MDTPQKLSKAMKWAIEVLNEGGDLNSLLPEERSPSPRHIPARDRCRSPRQRPLNQMKPRHEEQCQRDICQFIHSKFQELEETMKETVGQQMAQLMNIEKAGTSNCVRPSPHPTRVHDQPKLPTGQCMIFRLSSVTAASSTLLANVLVCFRCPL
jgi:hypothetical protein